MSAALANIQNVHKAFNNIEGKKETVRRVEADSEAKEENFVPIEI